MKCSNCKYEWCWSCGLEINNLMHTFGGYYLCNLTNELFEMRNIKNPVLRWLAYIFMPFGVLLIPFIGIIIAALYFVFGFLFCLIAALLGYTLTGKCGCCCTFFVYFLQLIFIVPAALIILVLGTIAIAVATTLYYIGLVVIGLMFMFTWCCKNRRAYVQIEEDD